MKDGPPRSHWRNFRGHAQLCPTCANGSLRWSIVNSPDLIFSAALEATLVSLRAAKIPIGFHGSDVLDCLQTLEAASRFCFLGPVQAANRWRLCEKDVHGVCCHVVKDAMCFRILFVFRTTNIVCTAIRSITTVLSVPSCALLMSHATAAALVFLFLHLCSAMPANGKETRKNHYEVNKGTRSVLD